MTPTTAFLLRSLLSGGLSNQRLVFLRLVSSFSSISPEASVANPSNRTASIFEEQSDGGGSAVYNHALKYSRPLTINLLEQRSHLYNSVCLIGTVERTPTVYNTRGDDFGVYTMLKVKTSPDSHSLFRIQVAMWDEIAKVALEHLNSGDYIYASGRLEAYRIPESSGNDILRYKITVKEFNYVKQHNEKQRVDEVQQSKPQGGSSLKNKEDRLHLWQVFFTNPQEWHDWRQNKRNPKSPDFKHKSTGEALWINAEDPPWIIRQIELLDSMVAAGCFEEQSSRHRHVSNYISDEL